MKPVYRYLVVYILAPLIIGVVLLILLNFLPILPARYHVAYKLVVVPIVLLLMLATYFGLIGPKKLKDVMREFNTWIYRDAEVLLPVDPYQPLLPQLAEGARNVPPQKERIKNALLVMAATVIVLIIIPIVAIGAIYIMAIVTMR